MRRWEEEASQQLYSSCEVGLLAEISADMAKRLESFDRLLDPSSEQI
jgi:hypothetical protein